MSNYLFTYWYVIIITSLLYSCITDYYNNNLDLNLNLYIKIGLFVTILYLIVLIFPLLKKYLKNNKLWKFI
mgnify:CR=1 FL=1